MSYVIESENRLVGNSISFIDIDETTMHTFAKVNVIKDGKVVKELNNQEFNTYQLKDGETFNFDNFKDAQYFYQTSKPIDKMIERLKKVIGSINHNNKLEKIIFLTARSDFDNKEVFLQTFRQMGIDIDCPNVYVERSGNLTDIKNVSDRKKYTILKYLKSGLYSAVRMIDDDLKNLQTFSELGKEINEGKYGILKNVQQNYPRVKKILFFPLLTDENGKLSRYGKRF